MEGDRLRLDVRCEDMVVCGVRFVEDDEDFVTDDRVDVDELLDMDDERTKRKLQGHIEIRIASSDCYDRT